MTRKGKGALIDSWKGIQHARIRHEVLNSPAWRILPFSAKALYLDLRAKLNSTNNGNIEATLTEMTHRGWNSSATLTSALRALEHMGFIAKTRQGGIAAMSKVCNLYRFTDLPVFEHPKQGVEPCKATLDWRQFDSVRAAESHLHSLRRKQGQRKKSKLQNLKLIASEYKPMNGFTASESESGASA